VGTVGYIAPEQAAGQAVDPRADLFSLGSVLYELLTRRRPFGNGNPVAVLTALATQQPASPSSLRPDIPAALSALIMRLLAKSPAERPASAAAVEAELAAMEGAREVDCPPTTELPKVPFARRGTRYLSWITIAAAVVIVALLLFAAATRHSNSSGNP